MKINRLNHDVSEATQVSVFRTAEPVEYYRSFLKENCRPDGRELGEFRVTTLNIGSLSTADGSALVKVGNTTVICGVKGELAAPTSEAPDQGFIVPNLELPPLCSPRFRPGPPGEQAQAASQFLADVIDSSHIIALQDLCIEKGKLAWVLYCDLMCLDYDGNILDACSIALLAALQNLTLPKVGVSQETGLAQVTMQERLPVKVGNHPVSTSFSIFDGTVLLVDPTDEEEALSCGTVTIVTDEADQLCAVHKPGGSPLSAEQMQDCVTRALQRGAEVRRLLHETIKSVRH
ncbi:exosome complex component RRP43 isoform X1 [Lampetra planeri]